MTEQVFIAIASAATAGIGLELLRRILPSRPELATITTSVWRELREDVTALRVEKRQLEKDIAHLRTSERRAHDEADLLRVQLLECEQERTAILGQLRALGGDHQA